VQSKGYDRTRTSIIQYQRGSCRCWWRLVDHHGDTMENLQPNLPAKIWLQSICRGKFPRRLTEIQGLGEISPQHPRRLYTCSHVAPTMEDERRLHLLRQTQVPATRALVPPPAAEAARAAARRPTTRPRVQPQPVSSPMLTPARQTTATASDCWPNLHPQLTTKHVLTPLFWTTARRYTDAISPEPSTSTRSCCLRTCVRQS
jgi:hypothetical protein